jgi:hypothetical protein
VKKDYEAPAIRDLGSLTELTQQQFNKVGATSDLISTVSNQIVGSLVGFP